MAPPSTEETNRLLQKWCPELDSQYAKYPMRFPRWLDPKEKDPTGKPCFVQGPDAGPKPDYVYGPGTYGQGYYHLLTKASYLILRSRLSHEYPGGCCACSQAARKELDEYDDVRRILHARSVAQRPDDQQAQQDAIAGAKEVAQNWHNGLQNEQLAIGAVQTIGNF